MLLFSKVYFLFYFFIDPIGNADLKRGSDPARLPCLLHALKISANVSSPARLLAGFVKGYLPFGASYHSEKLVFREMLAAAGAFSRGLLFFLCHLLRLDVDLAACKLCYKLCILTFLTDSKRKLVGRNGDPAGLFVLHNYVENLSG